MERALRDVDRRDFVHRDPYEDAPQLIGYNVTISAPHMHSYCLDQVVNYCKPGAICLDIGCGSGIFTVLMSALALHSATVVGLDHIPGLVDMSRNNAAKHYSKLIGGWGSRW